MSKKIINSIVYTLSSYKDEEESFSKVNIALSS